MKENLVFSGLLAFVSSSVIVKFSTLFSQFALGWILTKEEYGIFGIAISITAFSACFQENTISKYLIQKGERAKQLQAYGFVISLIFACLTIITALIVGGGYAYFKEQNDVAIVAVIIACSSILGFGVPVYRASALVRSKFKRVALIDGIKLSMTQVSMIPLAILGFGVYSLAWPRPGLRIFEWLAYRQLEPEISARNLFQGLRCSRLFLIFRDLRWIMLSAFLIALIQRGDYFVFGFLVEPKIVGLYFFGFQLISSFSNMLTGSLNQVFMPSLAKLNYQPNDQARSFESASALMLASVFPVFYLLVIALPDVIHYLWSGKWDEAAIVCQILCLVMPIRFVVPLARSLFEARGLWRFNSMMMGVNAAGVLLAAGVGGIAGDIESMALCVASWQVMYGLFVYIAVRRICCLSIVQPISVVLRLIVCHIAGLSLAFAINTVNLFVFEQSVFETMATALVYLAFSGLMCLVLCRNSYISLFRKMRFIIL